jgi:hypothetical protein
MTRKHFVALAEAVRFLEADYGTRLAVAKAVASVCRRFNSRFSEYRFLAACRLLQSD